VNTQSEAESTLRALEVRPVTGVLADLGEGPDWDPIRSVLRYVDITNCTIHRYDPAEDTIASLHLPQAVSAVIPRQSGGLVATVRDGIAGIDEKTGTFELIVRIEADTPSNRMNDAKCDPAGRLWAGTMAHNC
jgi:sugar lactone lactonase YvrE